MGVEVGCNLKIPLWSVANITSDRIGRRDFLERWQAGDEKTIIALGIRIWRSALRGPPRVYNTMGACVSKSHTIGTDGHGPIEGERASSGDGTSSSASMSTRSVRIRHVMPEGTPTASPTGRFAPVSTRDETPAQPTTPAEANRTSASPSIGSWNRGRKTIAVVSEEEAGASDEDGDDGDDSFDDSAKGDTPEKTVGIPHDPPQPTHVHVVVVSCKGLRGADFTGYSDPFVEVGAFGATKNRRFRTKPRRQTLNPSWNTNEARFLVACDASSSDGGGGGGGVPFQGLVFSVFDKDLGSSSQFLGGAAIAARDVPSRGRWMETELTLTRSHPRGAIAEAETDAKVAGKYAIDPGGCRGGKDGSTDLGFLKVRVAFADDLLDALVSKPLLVPREGKFTHDVAMGLGLKTRRVHVCVVAGKHLVSADDNGLSDPFVQVALDNSPASAFNSRSNRTKTARRTLNPVWGGGRGETFTFARAPGASEVQLRLWDDDGGLRRSQFLGIATVPLHEAPRDGSWSDNLTVSLFPDGPSQEVAHSGQCMGHLVVRVAAASPSPKDAQRRPKTKPGVVGSTPGGGESEFWPDLSAPPPAPDAGPYVNKVTSSTFVYFQICGTRDLPTYRRGPEETTNVKATVALNSDGHVHHTAVQAEVLKDAVWMPEVCSFPKNPNSSTVTVRVYGNLTKLWDPTVMTDMARDVTMGIVDRGESDADADKKKSSRYSQSKAAKTKTKKRSRWDIRAFGPDLNKKHFALGTLIGEVKIPVAGLTPGETSDPRWLPIAPVRSDDDTVPGWLAPYGDRLGEICVAMGAGFLREAPEDLVNPSDHWVLPALGELEVRVLEVAGDPAPKDIASSWFGWGKSEDEGKNGAGNAETENMLGADVSVQLLWEGRAEKVATPHEHRSFGVTDPASELRVLVLAEGPLAMDEVLLGAAVLPVRDVIDALRNPNARDGDRGDRAGRVDAWLDVISPHREARSSDMSDVNFRMRAHRTRRPRGWRGRVRVSVKLVPKRACAMHRWYLRQVPRPRGEAYVDDTFKGVVASAERFATAILAPITAPLAAMAHTLSGTSPGLNNAWIAWHTALCLCARRHVLWAFFPLWCASGACFVGYACALARDACGDVPGMYTGGRVLRTMSVREGHVSERRRQSAVQAAYSFSPSVRFLSPSVRFASRSDSTPTDSHDSSTRQERVKDQKTLRKKLIEEEERDLEEEERGIFGDESGLEVVDARSSLSSVGDDVLHATPLRGAGMKVAGNAVESDLELCRLRVQRWLKELRRLRAKVTREIADAERVEALRAKGQSTKAALQLIRRADAASGRKRDKRLRRGKDDDDGDHRDDTYAGLLLKRMPFAGIVKMFSSTNPAELIVRLLQQLTWTLLLLLKAIGVTLFGSVVSLGKVHRALAGPCRAICAAIDPWNDRLEALGGVLSFRDGVLSYYACLTVTSTAALWSAVLYLGVLPVWTLLDAHSPVRLWHLAWIAGVAPCVPAVSRTPLMNVVVAVERILQNALGGLRVRPISLASIQALERQLEEEFIANGGSWDGVERAMRDAMLAQTKEACRRAEAKQALTRSETREGAGMNPLRWIAHATARAPTRLDHEHHELLRLVNVPARPGPRV